MNKEGILSKNIKASVIRKIHPLVPDSAILKILPLIPDKILRLFFPTHITIEPIAGCNLKCVACPVDCLRRPKGKMKLEHFKKIICEVENVKYLQLFFMGEPLLHPKIFDMIEFAKSKNITVKISTNGTTLKKQYKRILESGVDELIICLDGFSQESIEKYRKGAKFKDIVEGISKLTAYKKEGGYKTVITLKTLIFKHNENELGEIEKFARHVGVDHFLLVKSIISGLGGKQTWGELEPSQRREFVRPAVKPKPPCKEWVLQPIVTWEGDLIPCCFDVHAEYKYGNIIENEFDKVYWSPEGRKMRNNILKMRLGICKSCQRLDFKECNIYVF